MMMGSVGKPRRRQLLGHAFQTRLFTRLDHDMECAPMLDEHGCCRHHQHLAPARWECLPSTCCRGQLGPLVVVARAGAVIVVAVLLVAMVLVAMGYTAPTVVAVVGGASVAAAEVLRRLMVAVAAIRAR